VPPVPHQNSIQLWRFSRREINNVLSVSGDEQTRAVILMLKLLESFLRTSMAALDARVSSLQRTCFCVSAKVDAHGVNGAGKCCAGTEGAGLSKIVSMLERQTEVLLTLGMDSVKMRVSPQDASACCQCLLLSL
jgi:hypothetical protein